MNTQRIQPLQRSLKKNEGYLIETPLNLFYLTGLSLSCGRLLLSKTAALLLVDGRYLEAAQKEAALPVDLDGTDALLAFGKRHHITRWHFDAHLTSYERFSQLQALLPRRQLIADTSSFETLRVIKDNKEIAHMKKSARLLWKGFLFLKKSLKVGVSERELAKQFELFCLKEGAERLAFDPIIAFGANTAMPHYHPQDRRLKRGDVVLFDIGVVVNKYHSDMTRVLFFKEEDPYLARLYALVKEAHARALSLCRPGTRFGELDTAAREVFRREKVEHLFVHSLGHGIGLETHEFPRIRESGKDKDAVLKKGMVFTIEPGLYVPGRGGARHEDTIVITDRGYLNFYK